MDQASTNLPAEGKMGHISGRKRILIIGLTLVILIALGAGAYFYFFQEGTQGGNENSNSEAVNNEISGKNAADNAVNVSKAQGDWDRDGLSDEEEKKSGTDPKKSDTDADGLSDDEEVNVYKTDPLKTDTDGDGHLDGVEVSSGYDPNGPGKLLNLNEAIKNLNTNN